MGITSANSYSQDISKQISSNSFDYIITPNSLGDRVNIDIHVTFKGNSNGETEIFLPRDRYGTRNIYTSISTFEVKYGQTTTVFEKPYLRKIYHKPNADLEIKYTISVDPELTETSSFSPVIESEIFHFLLPQWTLRLPDDFLKFTYSIQFEDVPNDWVALSNLPKNEEGVYQITAIQDDFEPKIVGGNYDYYSIELNCKPVDIAISYHFREINLFSDITKLLTSQRSFFDFDANDQFLVSVSKRDGILSGTAINDALSL